MADRVRKVNYCYTSVSSRAGHGARVLAELREAGVDLLAFSGFPTKGRKTQLDLVAQDMAAVRRIARKGGWRLSKTKKGLLVQGTDTVGAVARQLQKLADRKINVSAAPGAVRSTPRIHAVICESSSLSTLPNPKSRAWTSASAAHAETTARSVVSSPTGTSKPPFGTR